MKISHWLLDIVWNNEAVRAWCKALHIKAFSEYCPPLDSNRRDYQGGTKGESFNYLLLNPRIIGDLSRADFSSQRGWNIFLKSIFYIGKGLKNRPKGHFNDTRQYLEGNEEIKLSEKIRKIISLWGKDKVPNGDDHGVYVVKIFRHSMNEEACTREKLMVNALCPCYLTNGNPTLNYYGDTETTMLRGNKKLLGSFLLYTAMEDLEANWSNVKRIHAADYPLRPKKVAENILKKMNKRRRR